MAWSKYSFAPSSDAAPHDPHSSPVRQTFMRVYAGIAAQGRRRTRVVARLAVLAPLLLAATACGDLVRLVTPGARGAVGPATIAFTANVPRSVASANDVVTLSVTAAYVRQDGTRVRIGSQLLALTAETLQAVPIPVDVATCIADGARDTGGMSGTASCAVVLSLALQVNGVVVDEQTVGPLRVSPGSNTVALTK